MNRQASEICHDPTNLFLTGPSGVGKTTMLFSVLGDTGPGVFGPPGIGGFVVKRVYEECHRVAMDLVDLGSGERARLLDFGAPGGGPGAPRVRIEAFTRVGVPAIQRALRAARLVVMDELGRFELETPLFLEAVTRALDSPVPVVGVLKAESNLFLDGIRARPDVKVITLGDSGAYAEARVAFEAAFRDLLRRSGPD